MFSTYYTTKSIGASFNESEYFLSAVFQTVAILNDSVPISIPYKPLEVNYHVSDGIDLFIENTLGLCQPYHWSNFTYDPTLEALFIDSSPSSSSNSTTIIIVATVVPILSLLILFVVLFMFLKPLRVLIFGRDPFRKVKKPSP